VALDKNGEGKLSRLGVSGRKTLEQLGIRKAAGRAQGKENTEFSMHCIMPIRRHRPILGHDRRAF
jgi:hypothetical protein